MADGDRIENLLRANSGDLLAFLERRLGPHDAPDALVEVMTTAWKRVSDLPDDDVEGRLWLFGVARYTIANTERSRARRSRLADALRHTMQTAAPSADRGLEVRDAIARLEPALAEVVRLHHWEGFALADIANITDTPASTVRSRYAKARAILASELSVEHPTR